MIEPFFVTFAFNEYWPELDWEWMVVPKQAANEDQPVVKITGTEFERGPTGWCIHCGWAEFAHVIGAQTGRRLCKADDPQPTTRT